VPDFGQRRLGQLQPQHVQAYQSDLLRRGLSASTITLHRSLLSRALNEAVMFGMIPRNVVSLVKPPKRSDDDPKGKAFPPEHARALLDASADDPLAVYYVLLLTAGLRRGEALGLSWKNIDLPANDDPDVVASPTVVHVRHQLQWPEGRPTIVPVKSRKGIRDVPVPSVTTRALCARRAAQRADYAARGLAWRSSELVLTTPEGKPVHPNASTKQFHAHRQAAALPYYRPHDLRHTYGSLLMSQRVPLKTISDLMGHSSIEVTADIYLHSFEGQVLDTANAVARALEETAGSSVMASSNAGQTWVCQACGARHANSTPGRLYSLRNNAILQPLPTG
jgi:integrase